MPRAVRDHDVEGQQDGGRGVDGHGGRDVGQGQAVEQGLHVVQRGDGHAHAADLAAGRRGVGVVAHLGRQVEGHREPGLALLQQVAEALVGVGRGGEAGVLAHRPQAAAVHRGLDTARERELPRAPQVACLVEARRVGRRVQVGDRQVARGAELGLPFRLLGQRPGAEAAPPGRRGRDRRRSYQHRQLVATLDPLARLDRHPLDAAGALGPDLVLHLHRFHGE